MSPQLNAAAPTSGADKSNAETNPTPSTQDARTETTFNVNSPEKAANAITLIAPVYMQANFNPRYSALFVECRRGGGIDVILRDSWAPINITEDGTVIFSAIQQTGQVDMRAKIGRFWDYGEIYFDEVKTTFPRSMRTVTKQIHVGDGKYETRSERILNDPFKTINNLLLPKLKTGKTMRIQYGNISGPTFELGDIKEKIETLEAQCASGGAQQ